MKIGIISLGWLGQQLYKRLDSQGEEVWGTYANTPKNLKGEVQFDINTNKLPEDIGDSDWIIFNLPPSKISSIDIFKNFLNSLEEQTLIFVSSTSVYGQEGDLTEDDMPEPISDNGKFLLECEKLVNSYGGSVVRPAGLYGDKRHPGRYMAGREVNSDPDAYVNLISGKDVCDSILKLIGMDAPYAIVNAVNIHHPKKGPFYSNFCEKYKLEAPVFNSSSYEPKRRISSKYPEFSFKSKLI